MKKLIIKKVVLYTNKATEIEAIANVCLEYGIKFKDGGTVFEGNAKDIRSVCEVCKKFGIDCSKGGLIFTKTASEIEEIVNICREYNISYEQGGGVFKSKPETLRRIAEICKNEGVEIKGAIFFANPEKLQQSINYVRYNYGDMFVNRMIVFQNPERLMEVMPYLEKQGYLEELLGKSAGILSLTLDEIKEREKVIESVGEEIIVNGNFNSIFGQTRKVYKEKYGEIIKQVNNGESGYGNHK